ncbi:MAG TPA: DUF1572 family protein [Saprospiraceae bacterium]|nr:DUF1572 family protein [Saprospiraceae bacterium]
MKSYLTSVLKEFNTYKTYGERAIQPLTSEEMLWKFNDESNSIAVIIQHLRGNMLSRWTDFFHTDGEKSWRYRDTEFEDIVRTKDELLQLWEEGWNVLLKVLENLGEKDLEKIILIRNEPHTVTEAINRQLAHYASHVGQIIYIARMIQGANWKSLTIPKGGTEVFNQKKFSQDQGII